MMTEQASLFAASAPLAQRLRPRTLAEYVGQQHIVGQGTPLAVAVERKQPFSMVLWGAPGCGKTTLALLLAHLFDAEFIRLSAVFSGVKEVREASIQAQLFHQNGRQTLLFIDEIHRFNKAQQDALLPDIENGAVIFIGATTENPAFHLNRALLSRVRVLALKPLSAEDIEKTLRRGLSALGKDDLSADAELKTIARFAGGDARNALNDLEEWSLLLDGGLSPQSALEKLLAHRPQSIDKQGTLFYEQLSAFHKSLRGSSVDGALYWCARMLEGGVDPLILCRRMLCVASEDIGNADPNALNLALNTYQTFERLGAPEGYLAIAQCVTYLALAPKSNAAYLAFNRAVDYVKNHPAAAVPEHLTNTPAYGKEKTPYRYPHDEAFAYAVGQRYLPDQMENIRFYYPNERGFERKLADKLARLQELEAQAADNA